MSPRSDAGLRLLAPAKVNLTLEVLGRRPDGFHEVRTVLQKVDLGDEITLSPAADLSLRCDVPELSNEDNLVLRAARGLRQEAGITAGAHIELRKRIPSGVGLGGGSSDAATCLLGLSRLWGLRLSQRRLAALAAGLGSDVPFFLGSGTALARGRGEVVEPLAPLDDQWFVLLVPPLGLPEKTRTLYGLLASEDFTAGEATNALVRRLRRRAGLDPALFYNAFDRVARRAFPGLDGYRRQFEEAGGHPVHLCGSGPALFAPAAGAAEGERIAGRLRQEGLDAWVVRALP